MLSNKYNELKTKLEQQDETVLPEVLQEYQNGNPEFAYLVGFAYLFGIGIDKNRKKALKYFKKSAEVNNIDAILWLGSIYSGDLLPYLKPKYKLAHKYYKTSHELNSLMGTSNFGNLLYTRGEKETGFNLIKEAYDKGYKDDVWLLFRLYEEYKQDFKMAFDALNDVEPKDIYAYIKLGRCYRDGRGTEKDEIKALKYFSIAMNLGNEIGMRELGLCYLLGIGTNVSKALGTKYIEMASDNKDYKSIDILDKLKHDENADFREFLNPNFSDPELLVRLLQVRKKLKWTKFLF